MAKHLTEVPIYDVFHWSIDATEHHVVAATQRLRLNPQVHLKMRKKVDVFSGLEGDKGYQRPHRCGNHYHLCACMRIHLAFQHFGAHFPHEVLVDRVHLKSCSVQTPIFPLELSSSWVVFCVIFAASRQPIDINVFEFVYSNDCILIEHAEACRPSLEDVICKDVQLSILWLVFEHVNAFREVSCENTAALSDLDADNR